MRDILVLDANTVRAEHVILLAVFCLLTFANWRINRGTRGMQWFSAYSLCFFLATCVSALRGRIPNLYALALGNTLIIATQFLLFLSIADLVGRRKWQVRLQWALLAAGAFTMLQYGELRPDTNRRFIAFSLVLGLQQAQIALLLYRRKDAQLRAAGAPLAWVLIALMVLNLFRIVTILIYGDAGNYLVSGAFLLWIEAGNSCLQCGTVVAYIWMTASILRRDLELQATTDPLTGLLNRRALDRLATRVLRAERPDFAKTSVITMDLDGFKKINDTLGHGCGDQTLICVSECLRDQLRANDLVARLGGDEFVVLLPRTSLEVASGIAERLRKSIEVAEITWGEQKARVTASLGLAQLQGSSVSWHQLVTRCDRALYAAKRAGGNRVECAAAADALPAISETGNTAA